MNLENEIFVSHIVYSMLIGGSVFKYVDSTDFKDWGTMKEWTDVMNNHQTIFCDYDGVIVKNKGKFGVTNWYNSDDEPIEENIKTIKELNINIFIKMDRCGMKIFTKMANDMEFGKNGLKME
jgi:hypothetical protein